MIERLAEHIPGVLLLTATPEQLGQQSHFARLRLLDASRFHDYHAFVAEQQKYQPVADAVTLLLNGERLADDAEQARQALVTLLMDRHGTSRVLFRNTRNGVKGFSHRHLHLISLPLPPQYQTAIKISGIMGTKQSIEARARAMLYPEQIYQAFEGENATWWNFDPRVEWLLDHLIAHRHEEVLVICAKAEIALQLE